MDPNFLDLLLLDTIIQHSIIKDKLAPITSPDASLLILDCLAPDQLVQRIHPIRFLCSHSAFLLSLVNFSVAKYSESSGPILWSSTNPHSLSHSHTSLSVSQISKSLGSDNL